MRCRNARSHFWLHYALSSRHVSPGTRTEINTEIHARSRWQPAIIAILSFTCIHAVASESRPEQSATYRAAICWFLQKEKKVGDASNVKRRRDDVTEAITQASGSRILQRSRNRLGSHRLCRRTLRVGVCQSEMRCSREVNFNYLTNFTRRRCVTTVGVFLFFRRLLVLFLLLTRI